MSPKESIKLSESQEIDLHWWIDFSVILKAPVINEVDNFNNYLIIYLQ